MTPFLRRLIAPRQSDEAGDERVRTAALSAALHKINHDLRNTLAAAGLAADRLAKSEDPLVARMLPRLIESIERASALATAALKAVGPGAPLFPTHFLLRELVAETAGALGDAAATLVNEVAMDAMVGADRALLGGALLQVVRNAAESGAKTVRVAIARANGRVRITLTDDGPGLPKAAQEKLFTPFLGAARTGGVGLGLPFVREIMRVHGGEMRIASTGAEGTTVVLELPDSPPAAARFWI